MSIAAFARRLIAVALGFASACPSKTASTPTPTAVLATRPRLPPLPSIGIANDGTVNVSQRITYLLDENPVPEVAIMAQAVMRGELAMILPPNHTGAAAQFGVLELQPPPGQPKDPTSILQPILVLNQDDIRGLETQEDVLRMMLILAHEARHYCEYLAAPATEKRRFVLTKERPISTQTCEHLWRNEYRGYDTECAYAIAWKLPDVAHGLCAHHGKPEFASEFSGLLIAFQDHAAPECVTTWTRLGSADR